MSETQKENIVNESEERIQFLHEVPENPFAEDFKEENTKEAEE